MNSRISHLALGLLFAVLQIIAPLAHAHIDGRHTGTLLYSDEIYQHNNSGSVHTDAHFSAVESAAISMPHEFQRDPDHISTNDACQDALSPLLFADLSSSHFVSRTSFIYLAPPHTNPISQAPPRQDRSTHSLLN